MKHYFVDLENVSSSGFEGIELLNEPSVIYLFLTEKTKDVSNAIKTSANSLNVSWKYDLADNGERDSLDIQLSSMLGYIIRDCPQDSFYIISKDKGFDGMVESWRRKGLMVERRANIKGKEFETEEDRAESRVDKPLYENSNVLESIVASKSAPCRDVNHEAYGVSEVLSAVGKSSDLKSAYLAIVKRWGQARGVEIYRKNKPILTEVLLKAKESKGEATVSKAITKTELRKHIVKKILTANKLPLVVDAINGGNSIAEIHKRLQEIYKSEKPRGEKVFAELQNKGILQELGKK